MSSSSNPPTALWGLYRRKERWGLSWRGWIAGIFLAGLVFTLYVFCIVPFLSVTDRVDARTLVVEGWIHDYAIRKSVDEFKNGTYQRLFTTGGPVKGGGGYTNDFNTSASVAAERLVAAGIEPKLVQMVPSRVSDLNRTYNSALALRDWLHQNHVTADQINIVTESIHARRTRLLFEKAFGDEVAIGIIAIPEQDYDLNHWWRFSEGVEEVFRESLSYLYAKFLFHPAPPKSAPHSKEQKAKISLQLSQPRVSFFSRGAVDYIPLKAGGGARSPLNTRGKTGTRPPSAAGLARCQTKDHSATDPNSPIAPARS